VGQNEESLDVRAAGTYIYLLLRVLKVAISKLQQSYCEKLSCLLYSSYSPPFKIRILLFSSFYVTERNVGMMGSWELRVGWFANYNCSGGWGGEREKSHGRGPRKPAMIWCC
jgi:hypothetical protein